MPADDAVYVDWQERTVTLADGEAVLLRKPKLRIEKRTFGALGPEVIYSFRIVQPMFRPALFGTVPELTPLGVAGQQKARGINGRPNQVYPSNAVREVLVKAVESI